MGYHKRGVDLAAFDLFEEHRHIFMSLGLALSDGETFVHGGPERYLVAVPDVNAWYRDRSALSAGPYRLA